MKKTNNMQQDTTTEIKSPKEIAKEVEITIDEIKAEQAADNTTEEVSEEEIKAALDILNPDEATMDRG
ncbi:MAG: hypothetical protein LBG19_02395 [Prevotellaceae bacterium]|jgi:hypothetical protein|nr:hypothetical protein [Prevotellaceae bacterium]